MERKFQVFISSTYTDLIDERQDILKAVLDLGHIPSGMEGFYAADEEQLSYIKRIIDECDYYILVIAGRYGAVDEFGVSYTEREYDYAISKGLVVLAFIHSNVSIIPSAKVDSLPGLSSSIQAFKRKVSAKRLVSFWESKEQLKSSVIISLSKAVRESPGVGWIRGDKAATEDVLQKMSSYRDENDALKQSVARLSQQLTPKIDDIAPMDSVFNLHYSYITGSPSRTFHKEFGVTWTQIIRCVAPSLISPTQKSAIDKCLKSFITEKHETRNLHYLSIPASDLDTIKVQLSSYGIIDVYSAESINGGVHEYVVLTSLGKRVMHDITTIRAAPDTTLSL